MIKRFLIFSLILIGAKNTSFSQCYIAEYPIEEGYYVLVDSIKSNYWPQNMRKEIFFKEHGGMIDLKLHSTEKLKHIVFKEGKCYDIEHHNKTFLIHPHMLGLQIGQLDEPAILTVDTTTYSSWEHQGTEIIAGKKCKVFFKKDIVGETTVWIWENILFKRINVVEEMSLTDEEISKCINKMEIVLFSDSLPAKKHLFEIPKEFKARGERNR